MPHCAVQPPGRPESPYDPAMTKHPALVLIACLALLGGCSAPATAPTSSAESTPSSASSVPADFECETPSDDLVDGMFDEEYDFTVLDYGAVRSPGHEQVWYVAVQATDGANTVIGLWASDSLSLPASVRAVDGIAKQFSSYPTDDSLSLNDDAAKAAKGCIV